MSQLISWYIALHVNFSPGNPKNEEKTSLCLKKLEKLSSKGVKKGVFKISQNSQENTCVEDPSLKSCRP